MVALKKWEKKKRDWHKTVETEKQKGKSNSEVGEQIVWGGGRKKGMKTRKKTCSAFKLLNFVVRSFTLRLFTTNLSYQQADVVENILQVTKMV